jgi:hypothetical protein
MQERPLERLNYFNGQRLQAGDFTLEQEYHIRVRRWLNRSLYTVGIASGLGVRKVAKAPRVRISPGLALDAMGREIILLEEREETVPGAHDDANKPIGLYLTIRYREDVVGRQEGACRPSNGSGDKVSWDGPTRVVAEPVFEWSRDVPREDSGKVLLAYVGLGKGCGEVNLLETDVRRYVGAASAAKVRQYALEGTRDIDSANPGSVRFHIRGRQPTSVTLYLRAEAFPTYFYTELGRHTHLIQVGVGDLHIPAHKHAMPAADTGAGSAHKHTVSSITADTDSGVWQGVLGVVAASHVGNPVALAAYGIAQAALFAADALDPGTGANLALSPRPFRSSDGDDVVTRVNMSITLADETAHTHPIPAETSDFPGDGSDQVIPLQGTGSANPSGVSNTGADYAGTTSQALTFVSGMTVRVDGVDVTDAVLRQIRNNRPSTENWTALGNGLSDQPLAATGLNAGTGAIRIDFLQGVTMSEGEHVVEMSVAGARNGGRIHFNLYVE